MSKDKIEVNMNVYDIPIVVEALEKANKEIERLNKILEDINFYIKQRTEENISDEVRIELRNIELITNGTIKVVK